MRIAILMSTYNGHKYLDKQLKSIAEQTLIKNVTLYIRDDGSTDDTFGIISKWKSEIPIVLYKEKNAGPAMSFWNLLKKTEISADYYAFCVRMTYGTMINWRLELNIYMMIHIFMPAIVEL